MDMQKGVGCNSCVVMVKKGRTCFVVLETVIETCSLVWENGVQKCVRCGTTGELRAEIMHCLQDKLLWTYMRM